MANVIKYLENSGNKIAHQRVLIPRTSWGRILKEVAASVTPVLFVVMSCSGGSFGDLGGIPTLATPQPKQVTAQSVNSPCVPIALSGIKLNGQPIPDGVRVTVLGPGGDEQTCAVEAGVCIVCLKGLNPAAGKVSIRIEGDQLSKAVDVAWYEATIQIHVAAPRHRAVSP